MLYSSSGDQKRKKLKAVDAGLDKHIPPSFLSQRSSPTSLHGKDTDMSDQEVIYSTPRFLQSSSESQHRLKSDDVQVSEIKDGKEFWVSWNVVAMSLGIFCLLLSVSVTVLGIKVFQYIEEKHHLEKQLQTLTQEYCTMKITNCSKREPTVNKTLEYDTPKNKSIQQEKELALFLTNKKICQRKKNLSKPPQNNGKRNEKNWSCCGVNCYYFTTKNEDWKGCKETCQTYQSSLVKIENDEELIFIQTQTYSDNYWIGLSYNTQESKWKWIDNSTYSGIGKSVKVLSSGKYRCAFLTSTRIDTIECSRTYYCICEKSIDHAFSAPSDRT